MDNVFILLLIGFLIGTFGTLIGAGGGFILVPLLILSHPGMPPEQITAISIAVVAANAVSGSIAYARSKKIDYKAGLIFGLSTIPGSVAGVFVVQYVPQKLFHIVFGILLMAVAIFLFTKKPKATRAAINRNGSGSGNTFQIITDSEGNVFQYQYDKTIGIIISIAVGFFSPLLGIGGGIIHVPAMVQLLHFPVYIATATSHFVLAIMSVASVITNFFHGNYNSPEVQKMLLGLCIGVVCGAQLGAFLSHKIKTGVIIKLLAICLAIVGLRILI
jgi:uncharacterized membrane protein YfcA